MNNQNNRWGYLRKTSELAEKAGKDKDTGLNRTGILECLNVVFPNVSDWVYNKGIPGIKSRKRPQWRSESLKMIVECRGLDTYKNPLLLKEDEERRDFFGSEGYKTVSIPYFIQLTNRVVKTLFGVDVTEPLFDEGISSMGPKEENTPAFLCYAGIKRMAKDFKMFPEQYEVNIAYS